MRTARATLTRWSAFAMSLALFAGAVHCATTPSPTHSPRDTRTARPNGSASVASPATSSTNASPGADAGKGAIADEFVVLVTDPVALRQIEARGGSLGALLDGAAGVGANDVLAALPRYASIVRSIEGDVAAAKAGDPLSGPGLAFTHRLFDVKKLRSSEARFELIAVSNRLDRQHAAPAACGEVRFIFRLAYATTRSGVAIASRLPATLAVSFWAGKSGDCRAIAQRWHLPSGLAPDGVAAWLISPDGPVGSLGAIRARFKSVEANLQLVRWPSTTRPDLGGHAEYLLRAFVEDKATGKPSDGLVAGPLENTPDVAKLKRDAALRAELVRWMSDDKNLARLDQGTAIIPEKFLAKRAISVSPRGLSRRANRPFRQLFELSAMSAIDPAPASRRHVKSPAALLRRLDELSCQGCHQSRSVAGFHLIGEETAVATSANAVALASSPHLSVDLARRQRRLRAVAAAAAIDEASPIAERGDDEPGRYGAHCGLGDPGFATWTCAFGLQCTPDDASTDDADVGTCLPETPAVGDPCEAGVIAPNADSHQDRITKLVARACGSAGVCETNRVGFPGGMCQASCASHAAGSICAGIPVLVGFNGCLAKKTPFEQCIAENSTPGGVRACDASTPCRDDYVCARGAAGGACMPPYFLFQLRVDGHP